MKKEDIKLDDLYRILHGEVPLDFYIELIIRALFVFFVLTFGMKYLGKRQSSQLTRTELAATATLAAATGLVILAPDRGLIPPLIIVAIMIFAHRWIHKKSRGSERFEFLVEGHISELVRDGVMNLPALEKERISRHQLFAQLRSMGILHLGEVSRFYLEANGDFSLLKAIEKKSGLPVIPDWDKDFLKEMSPGAYLVCKACGAQKQDDEDGCLSCKRQEWDFSVAPSGD